MVNVLILHDGEPGREYKATSNYKVFANPTQASNIQVTVSKIQDIPDALALKPYNVIIADFEGKQVPDQANINATINDEHSQRFFALLQDAVNQGAKPIVRMFSGNFGQGYPDEVEVPSALQAIVEKHSSTLAGRHITAAIAMAAAAASGTAASVAGSETTTPGANITGAASRPGAGQTPGAPSPPPKTP